MGCKGQTSSLAFDPNHTPATFEEPLELPGPQPDDNDIVDTSPTPDIPLKIADPVAAVETNILKPSAFILNAERVMIKEGKKIGTPCNFYLMRVLQVSGYSSETFLANDFDLYAKRHLKSAQVVHFVNDGKEAESSRLKHHLWSYPERTPFIMQWSRLGVRGHVAIVERINDRLIIYQASYKKYFPRKDQITADRLLSGFNRRTLSVYSEF